MPEGIGCMPIRHFLTNRALTSGGKPSSPEALAAPSTSLALRAQKKILGKLSNRSIMKHLVSDLSLRLFDALFFILQDYYSTTVAEKTINDMLKLAIKLGVMIRENQLNAQQQRLSSDFQKKMRSLALTIISFVRVDYSYDRNFLQQQLTQAGQKLEVLVVTTLSDKSVRRVHRIFDHLGDGRLLDEMFIKKGEYHSKFEGIVLDLEKLLDGEEA